MTVRAASPTRIVMFGAVLVSTVLVGAGCSTGSSSTSASPSVSGASASVDAAHNNQDVEFAQMMIPHHQQAIVMADMVPSHSSNAELIALAAKIKAAQAPEIAQMQSWLVAWGAPASASANSMEDHGHMSHGGESTAADGMMTTSQMQELAQANGAAFDKMWLQMMIEHHEGAVEMSKQELASGQNPQAKALAQNIITGQQAEIAQMQKMLKG